MKRSINLIIEYIFVRLSIISLAIKFEWQLQSVSIFNKWGNVFSTIAYTAAFIMFSKVIFANTKEFGGYNLDQVLLLMFVTQLSFFIYHTWTDPNVTALLEDIKTGNLDQILIKPLPSLFYLTNRKINIIGVLRDGLPPSIILPSILNWSNIHITYVYLFSAIVMFICGQIILNAFNFILVFPAFILGEAEGIRFLSATFDDLHRIPYEGQQEWVKAIFTLFVPVLISGVYVTSVLLGKTDSLQGIFVAIIGAISFKLLENYLWIKCLKLYSSASS